MRSGMYCESMATHAANWHRFKDAEECSGLEVSCRQKSPTNKYWMEVHCDADLVRFTEGVAALREKAEPKGCRVISTLLLRDPVEQAVSEWEYFYSYQKEALPHHPKEWLGPPNGTVTNFVLAHPEQEMWLLTTAAETRKLWDDPVNGTGSLTPEYNLEEYHKLKSCNAALELLEPAASKIDVVRRMDTPELFAAFWIELSTLAGFAIDGATNLKYNAHNSSATGAPGTFIPAAQQVDAEKANSCSSQMVERFTDPWSKPPYKHRKGVVHTEVAIRTEVQGIRAPEAQVDRLLSAWGGREAVARSLGVVGTSSRRMSQRSGRRRGLQ